jgi:hypothetical protein
MFAEEHLMHGCERALDSAIAAHQFVPDGWNGRPSSRKPVPYTATHGSSARIGCSGGAGTASALVLLAADAPPAPVQ